MTASNGTERLIKFQTWFMGIVVLVLISGIPWAFSVNTQLGGIHASLRNQTRNEKKIDRLDQKIEQLQRDVYRARANQ